MLINFYHQSSTMVLLYASLYLSANAQPDQMAKGDTADAFRRPQM